MRVEREEASARSARPVVFVHTNAKQRLGARVSAHSFRLTAADPDAFDVRLLEVETHAALREAAGRTFLRGGHERAWDPADLQSFTPLRFAVPDEMDHRGTALVVDPDVFAVADAGYLLSRDLGGKPVWCRPRAGHNDSADYLATSVMLLDCGGLPDWDFERILDDLWSHRIDYLDLIELKHLDRDRVGLLAPEWNDFDRLTRETKLLHTTKRRTQPWKTGLRVDFTLRERGLGPLPASLVTPPLRWWHARTRYRPHPDPRQEAYFFALLADLLDQGGVTQAEVEAEVDAKHVRPDALALTERHRGAFGPARIRRA